MAEWDYRNYWDEALAQLKKELGEEEYSIWFSNIEYLRAEETVIYASVPTKFFLGYVSPRHMPMIVKKINELSGKNLSVTLEVQKKAGKAAETVQAEASEKQNNVQTEKNTRTPNENTEKKRIRHPQLQEEFTFETYVVGEDNNYAFNAASAVARNPGNSKIYNPLLIYGGTGLGKTHLMQAIGHYIHQNSDLKIIYTTGEGFMRDFVEIVVKGHNNKEAFAKKYRNVDALLIDDIHTIERGAGTQDELFYTFDALYNKKKQMVFTCDRPISELKGMAPRLQSRFQSGLKIELHMPKYEELVVILKKKMELKKAELKKDISISDEIIDLIIKNISSNVREMEGALNKLMMYADLGDKKITMEIAQRELKDDFSDPKQGNMSIDIIQRVVADEYHLTPNDLKGKKRTKAIVRARQIAMYLCRELTEYSQTEIGQFFGDRDHTTVLHSCSKIEEESRSDSGLYSTLERLKRMIKEYNVK